MAGLESLINEAALNNKTYRTAHELITTVIRGDLIYDAQMSSDLKNKECLLIFRRANLYYAIHYVEYIQNAALNDFRKLSHREFLYKILESLKISQNEDELKII